MLSISVVGNDFSSDFLTGQYALLIFFRDEGPPGAGASPIQVVTFGQVSLQQGPSRFKTPTIQGR